MSDYHSATEDRTMPVVCYALYLLAFATGVTAIAGLVIASTQRQAAGPVMQSHYTFLIRTFWIGLAVMIAGGFICGVGGLLTFILIGFPILAAGSLLLAVGGVWFGVRAIVGLVYVSRGEPYPRPYAVLV